MDLYSIIHQAESLKSHKKETFTTDSIFLGLATVPSVLRMLLKIYTKTPTSMVGAEKSECPTSVRFVPKYKNGNRQ